MAKFKITEKFIMAHGCATRVSYTGTGDKTILLLHGYLESLDIWEDFMGLLAPAARVIAIDLPGHGISEVMGEVHTMEFMAEVAYEAIKSLGVEKAVVVGHSMGGYVALEFLNLHPEATAGLVLFHSTANADSEKKANDRLREIELIRSGKKELIARAFPHVGFAEQNRKRMADEIEDLVEQITLTDDDGIIAVLNGMRQRKDNNEALRKSTVPQMAVLGRHDEYITQEAANRMLAAQPQMKVVWLEDSGHMGFIEEPQKSAEAIIDFVNNCADYSSEKQD